MWASHTDEEEAPLSFLLRHTNQSIVLLQICKPRWGRRWGREVVNDLTGCNCLLNANSRRISESQKNSFYPIWLKISQTGHLFKKQQQQQVKKAEWQETSVVTHKIKLDTTPLWENQMPKFSLMNQAHNSQTEKDNQPRVFQGTFTVSKTDRNLEQVPIWHKGNLSKKGQYQKLSKKTRDKNDKQRKLDSIKHTHYFDLTKDNQENIF